jgi:hypothetical protein
MSKPSHYSYDPAPAANKGLSYQINNLHELREHLSLRFFKHDCDISLQVAHRTALHLRNNLQESADRTLPHPTPQCASATSSNIPPASTPRSTTPTQSPNARNHYRAAFKCPVESHRLMRRIGQGTARLALRS